MKGDTLCPEGVERLTDGDDVAVEYEPVRGWGAETKTLERPVVENGLTPDDDAVYLARYFGENDHHPRRRLVVDDESGTVTLEARRSTDDGTVWAALGEAVVRTVPEPAVVEVDGAAPATAD